MGGRSSKPFWMRDYKKAAYNRRYYRRKKTKKQISLLFGTVILLSIIAATIEQPHSISKKAAAQNPLPNTIGDTAPSHISSYRPDFDCSRANKNDSIAVMLCHNSDAAKHELIFDQTYYVLRQIVGKTGWQALKLEAIADQEFADCLNNVGQVNARQPKADPACYIEKIDSITSRYQKRLHGAALEEAQRPIDEHISLQRRLISLGYLPTTTVADGVYGETTRTAIMAWQRDHNISPADGFLSTVDASLLTQEESATYAPATIPASDEGEFLFLAFIIGGVGIGGLYLWIRRKNTQRAWNFVSREIIDQKKNLQIQYVQKTRPDRYGTVNYDEWSKEVSFFTSTRIKPLLDQRGLSKYWKRIESGAITLINEFAQEPLPISAVQNTYVSDPRKYDPRMDPFDYEQYCALLLQADGWNAHVTQKSGDQGADVIASKEGCKIAIQCKLYSKSVGNDAVQQAFTARTHTGSTAAIVATNSTFTKFAYDASATTGVFLVHHAQLVETCDRILAHYTASDGSRLAVGRFGQLRS